MSLIVTILTAALNLTICGLCIRAEQRISHLKTYYPMLRVGFAVLAAVYGIGGIAVASGQIDRGPVVRLLAAVVTFVAMVWANRFVDRRNANPQYVVLDMRGHVETRREDELRVMALNVGSWARHGAMPAEVLIQLEHDIAGWHRMRAWREGLAAEAQERRAQMDAAQEQHQ